MSLYLAWGRGRWPGPESRDLQTHVAADRFTSQTVTKIVFSRHVTGMIFCAEGGILGENRSRRHHMPRLAKEPLTADVPRHLPSLSAQSPHERRSRRATRDTSAGCNQRPPDANCYVATLQQSGMSNGAGFLNGVHERPEFVVERLRRAICSAR